MSDNMYIGEGAQISGQVAMGRNVSQVQRTSEPSAGADLFDRVAALIDEHEAALPDARRARRDLADAREEAEADDGDTERRDNALARLAARVAPVAALAEAVHRVMTAL